MRSLGEDLIQSNWFAIRKWPCKDVDTPREHHVKMEADTGVERKWMSRTDQHHWKVGTDKKESSF